MNSSTTLRFLQFRTLLPASARLGKRLAVVVALFLFAISAHADTLHLSSTYKYAGKNPDGSKYSGTLSVKILSDTTISLEWKSGDDHVTKGFGMRMNDSIAATYMLDGEPGLVIYKVNSDGSMTGIWAIKGQDGNGTETLTPED
jgi:hypothetical protein